MGFLSNMLSATVKTVLTPVAVVKDAVNLVTGEEADATKNLLSSAVEDVEELSSEFQLEALRDLRSLGQGEVVVGDAVSANTPIRPGEITERERWRNYVAGFVEPAAQLGLRRT